ncbi:MAG: hypothetical protein WCR51_12095, partial [Planctomycetia bacterium]
FGILFKMPTTTTKLSKNDTSRRHHPEGCWRRLATCHGQRFTSETNRFVLKAHGDPAAETGLNP